ncbi:UNVERIFIED_ORG: DNA-binding CsgD family transcriptional regulator [Arthrobacter globiformis]|nr:DNA-binding CsgD family transcriptional regulator [Arthrobacter globiformis]
MARNAVQYRTWLEFLGEILQQPHGTSTEYERQVLSLLGQSFNGACVTRNLVSRTWQDHVIACWPRDYLPNKPPPGDFIVDATRQPLLRWYAVTEQAEPQSLGRVPAVVASNRLKGAWDEVVRPWGVSNELAIPVQMGEGDHSAYVISRPDRDFHEEELALAGLLQPILRGLTLHVGLSSSNVEGSSGSTGQDLTLRETAVLALLSEGLTAEAIARRLGISPRTAGKHLEHVYRKLDVCDRLMAVQRAHDLGLLVSDRS